MNKAYLISHHWELVREETHILATTFRVPSDAGRWLLSHRYASYPDEQFGVMLLNTRNQIILCDIVSKGSLNGSLVHPSRVFKSAIVENAAGVICFHNHPSGDLTPSREDLALTKRLREAGKHIGIELLDHVILSPQGTYVSLKEKELL